MLDPHLPGLTRYSRGASLEQPRCKKCKKALSNTQDRMKSKEKWWTNCSNCRTEERLRAQQRRISARYGDAYERRELPQLTPTHPESSMDDIKPEAKRQKIEGTFDNQSRLPPRNYPTIVYDSDHETESGTKTVNKRARAEPILSPFRKPLYLHVEPDNDTEDTCVVCGEYPIPRWLTACNHIMCEGCLDDALWNDQPTCYACQRDFRPAQRYESIRNTTEVVQDGTEQLRDHKALATIPPNCAVCDTQAQLVVFSACTHQPDTCSDCVRTWVASQLEQSAWDQIRCPSQECNHVLTHADVKKHASADDFTR